MTPHHPWSERFAERFLEVPLDRAFRRIVIAYRDRHDMSARRFGLLALGDPGFVGFRLDRGRAIRVGTADRALEFMGEPGFRPFLLRELDAYGAVTGTQAYLLGAQSVGDPSFVCRFRGGRSPLLRTLDRARRWMQMHSTAEERRAMHAAALVAAPIRAGVSSQPQSLELS